MSPTLRPYQVDCVNGVYSQWNAGANNVLLVLPTGGGKTPIVSSIFSQWQGNTCAIAHRQELVSQISMSHASFGLPHRLIAPKNVIRNIINEHRREFGRSFYNPQAPAAVAGVDTLMSRADELKQWAAQVTLSGCDEGHHNLVQNKWGKATLMFPNARGLGVTATPRRADGKGLGFHSDGMYDAMVLGPSMRDLIDMGYLTDYRIVCPPSDFQVDEIKVTATGDYSQKGMKEASKKSHIVGDIVENYIKFASGKRGIVFVTDVDTAHHVARQFNAAGIRAESVSAKTPEHVRSEFIRRFRNGDIDVLVNVDLFGEGFDVPAVEVVIMARPTQSLAVYMQQFGRVLRPMDGKQYGIVIDHVGNVKRHNLPDIPRVWSLDAREKRSKRDSDPDVIPLTTCRECFQPYERSKPICPYCGHEPVPDVRGGPEQVDGDLQLISIDILTKMREAVQAIDTPPEVMRAKVAAVAGEIAGKGAANKHREKQEAQANLRHTIAIWAAHQRAQGYKDRESYKRFYLMYGIDVLSAQGLNRADAEQLEQRIRGDE